MSDKSENSEISELLKQAASDDPDIAKQALEILAKALETPLWSKVRDETGDK